VVKTFGVISNQICHFFMPRRLLLFKEAGLL
jgi:hypothetical protein